MTQNLLTPIYTTLDSVKVRLAGKVQFQRDPAVIEEGEMPTALLCQLIVDAETEVERDLCGRYAIPFQAKTSGSFAGLPDHSKRAVRIAVDLRAVMYVLMTDFGRGTHINAAEYYETQEKVYIGLIKKLLGQDAEGASEHVQRFRRTPPLDGMKLAPSNSEADDGLHGTVINTDGSARDAVTYAEEQLNNPGIAYLGRTRGVVR